MDRTLFSQGTPDRRIQEVVYSLIDEMKLKMFVDPDKATDEQALGTILSKVCSWEGETIKEVAEFAFEDANFHDAKIIY